MYIYRKKTLHSLRPHVENIEIPTNFVKCSPNLVEKNIYQRLDSDIVCTVHRQLKISSKNYSVKNIECAIKKLKNKFKQVQCKFISNCWPKIH